MAGDGGGFRIWGDKPGSRWPERLRGPAARPPAPVSSRSRGCGRHWVAGLSGPRFPGLPCLQRSGSCHILTDTGAGLPTALPGPPAADLLTRGDPGPALGHPELRGGTSERSLAACGRPLWAATPQQCEVQQCGVPTGPCVTGTGERPTTLFWGFRQLPFELSFSISSHMAQSQISSYEHPSS